MVRVLLDNVLLADCDNPVILEGNYYFPPDSVRKTNLSTSNTSSICPWKGYYYSYHSTEMGFMFDLGNHSTASYYSAGVDGKDVAWYYADPKPKAAHIKNHVAFYKNEVIIED